MDILQNGSKVMAIDDQLRVLSAVTGRAVANVSYNENGSIITDAITGKEMFFIPGGTPGGGSGSCGDYYKCASVDIANNDWTGYKALLEDGSYTFAKTETTGLTFGNGYTPEVGGIYSADCMMIVDKLFVSNQPLTLTAKEAGSTVTLNVGANAVADGLMYRTDSGAKWQKYTPATTITLTNINDYVQFWNQKEQMNTDVNDNACAKFALSGNLDVSGNIMSMLNYADTCQDNALYHLFHECEALYNADVTLPASTINYYGCGAIFSTCTNLTGTVRIGATTIADRGFSAFMMNSKISTIEVNFTNWGDNYQFNRWVLGLPTTGTFIKPAALPEEFGENRIPTGWTVVNK